MFGPNISLGMNRASGTTTSGGAWTPLNLGAKLLGWWVASDTVGSPVSSWVDRVAGYNMAQATGSLQPLRNATGLNGQPTVDFDGTDDFLNMESQPFPSAANPTEIWTLARNDRPAAAALTGAFASYGGTNALTGRNTGVVGTGGVNRQYATTGTGAAATTVTNTNSVADGAHVLRHQFTATDTIIALDGGTPMSAAIVPGTGTTRVRFGARMSDVVAQWAQVGLAQVAITSPLTVGEATSFLAYLRQQGGI